MTDVRGVLVEELAGNFDDPSLSIVEAISSALVNICGLGEWDFEYCLEYSRKVRENFLKEMDARAHGERVRGDGMFDTEFSMRLQTGHEIVFNLLIQEARDRITKKMRPVAGSW